MKTKNTTYVVQLQMISVTSHDWRICSRKKDAVAFLREAEEFCNTGCAVRIIRRTIIEEVVTERKGKAK